MTCGYVLLRKCNDNNQRVGADFQNYYDDINVCSGSRN